MPRASAYLEVSFVQGLLGDLSAMRYYGDKAWKEGVAALNREAGNVTNFIYHPTEEVRLGHRSTGSFWSCDRDPK